MQTFRDRAAVVTGAASGIGRALAKRAAELGMSVAVADVDEAGLASLADELRSRGARVLARRADVSSEDEVRALADAAGEAFGPLHLVFNNAGVLLSGCSWERSHADWEWVLSVNLWGVIHGVRVFVPRLLEQGGPGHVVNTASVGGLLAGPFLAPYIVSKHAVVALSESLHHELRALGSEVGVSVLCPGATATGIARSERIRPSRFADAAPADRPAERAFADGLSAGIDAGVEPDRVAAFTFDAIAKGRFWILPDPTFAAAVEERCRSILEGTSPAAIADRG